MHLRTGNDGHKGSTIIFQIQVLKFIYSKSFEAFFDIFLLLVFDFSEQVSKLEH